MAKRFTLLLVLLDAVLLRHFFPFKASPLLQVIEILSLFLFAQLFEVTSFADLGTRLM